MNIFILTFHKYDKAFASDLYLIYNRSPAARVCKSDTDRLLMLYLVLNLAVYFLRVLAKTRADFVLDQSAHLFTFSLSANHNAGNEKFTPRRARKYCGLP